MSFGKGEAARVAKHVWMRLEREFGRVRRYLRVDIPNADGGTQVCWASGLRSRTHGSSVPEAGVRVECSKPQI